MHRGVQDAFFWCVPSSDSFILILNVLIKIELNVHWINVIYIYIYKQYRQDLLYVHNAEVFTGIDWQES